MKSKLKKLFNSWLFCMIITNIVIILIITIWNLYHCYGMMIYGDSLAEATYFLLTTVPPSPLSCVWAVLDAEIWSVQTTKSQCLQKGCFLSACCNGEALGRGSCSKKFRVGQVLNVVSQNQLVCTFTLLTGLNQLCPWHQRLLFH